MAIKSIKLTFSIVKIIFSKEYLIPISQNGIFKIVTMYTYIWNKYLPVIRILLKKSSGGDQLLSLNRDDFERAGTGRKAGYKFTIEFTEGKVSNVISGSELASHLASAMLEDTPTRAVLLTGHFQVILNTKFQITIKNTTPQAMEAAAGLEIAAE
jgi:hypothetical protein